jgi:hypothetical protein
VIDGALVVMSWHRQRGAGVGTADAITALVVLDGRLPFIGNSEASVSREIAALTAATCGSPPITEMSWALACRGGSGNT